MKINIFSTTYRDSIFRVGSHHIAEILEKRRHEVQFFSTPNSIINFLRFNNRVQSKRNIISFRHIFKYDVGSFVPICLAPYSLARNIASQKLSLFLSKPINFSPSFKNADMSLIDAIEYLHLIPQLLSAGQRVIYRPTDIYKNSFYHAKELETEFVKKLRIPVICMSRESYSYYNKEGFETLGFVENGVPEAWVNEYVGYNSIKSFKFVYVGAIDERLDLEKIELLKNVSNSNLFIYGIGSRVKELRRYGLDKFYHGSLPYSRVRHVLADCNVGLLPFNDNLNNLSRSPMKKYEYLSAGNYLLDGIDFDGFLSKNTFMERLSFLKANNLDQRVVKATLERKTWSNIVNEIGKMSVCSL